MFKRTTYIAACTLMTLAAGSSSAWAAGDASTVINIKAEIPSADFHAMPVDPNFGKNETMNYNPVSGSLSSLSQAYNLKSTGSIKAYIDGGPTALNNGNSSQNIALTTALNGTTLTAAPQEVAAKNDATAAGIQANLFITAAKPTTGASGVFTTNYTLMFDHIP